MQKITKFIRVRPRITSLILNRLHAIAINSAAYNYSFKDVISKIKRWRYINLEEVESKMAPCVSGSIQVHDLRNTHAIYCVSATLAQQVSCIFFSISIFIWLLNPTDSSQIGAKRKRKATPFSNYFTGNVDTNVKGKCFVNECHDLCVYSHEYNQNTCSCVCVCVCLNLLINASSPLSEQYAGLGFNVKIHIKYFNK